MLAHQVEAMARQKRLRPVDDYLKPIKSNETDERLFAALRVMEARGLVTIVEGKS